MSEIKRIRRRQQLRWGTGLVFFILLNLGLRLLLLPVNQAEYTDGILQLIQFQYPTGIYPPLYTAVTWPFSLIIGQLWAGRVVSYLFSSAAVIPLYLMARRSFGMRAAMFTALVYTVAPESLRWSTRVMTEPMFCFFLWFSCERLVRAQGATDPDIANKSLVWASVWGAMAAMTRYQGVVMIPLILGLAAYLTHVRKIPTWRGVASTALFLVVPLWSHFAGNIHAGQFADRTAALGVGMTFVNFAEPFVLLAPYFLTYPVALFVFVGFNVGRARNHYMMTPITIYLFVTLLIMQSLFASFQERYFLPFYGILFIWAGLGLAVVDDRCRRRAPRWRPYAPLVVTVWSLLFAALVILGSRQAFGDLRYASKFAGEITLDQPDLRVFSNEAYREGIHAVKSQFFAHRPVEFLSTDYYSGVSKLNAGDIVIFSTREDYFANMDPVLHRLYDLEELKTFYAVVTPVFPDLMQRRDLEQSPLAWLYRYVPQHFSTTVYRVRGARTPP